MQQKATMQDAVYLESRQRGQVDVVHQGANDVNVSQQQTAADANAGQAKHRVATRERMRREKETETEKKRGMKNASPAFCPAATPAARVSKNVLQHVPTRRGTPWRSAFP